MTRVLSILLVSAMLIAGCSARSVRIAELRNQPDRYDDKTVSVTGTVTRSWGVPLVPFNFYSIDDGSGQLTVVSNSGGPLRQGAHVRVKGRISEVAVFGGQSIGLHLRESDRRID